MRPVSISIFNSLDNRVKFALLLEHGVYLEQSYLSGSQRLCLFALFGYYVEVYYRQHDDRLLGAVAFSDAERLDPFLRAIDVRALYAGL